MDYLILSAATKRSVYEPCIRKQREIFEKQNANYLGLIFNCRGSWQENTKIKPDAIREGFKKSKVVLWIDADCLVDPPDKIPSGDWDLCLVENIRQDHKIRFSAGFILFRDTKATEKLLQTWESLNKIAKKDHPALKKALSIMQRKRQLRIGNMDEWLEGRQVVNYFLPERGIANG